MANIEIGKDKRETLNVHQFSINPEIGNFLVLWFPNKGSTSRVPFLVESRKIDFSACGNGVMLLTPSL